MSFFRTDLAPTYNPQQYANVDGQKRVASFLPGSQQTQTATAFGVAPQAITNYGGVNMNTGLINNLINQYGEAQARQMINDELKYAKANGGGNYDITPGRVNDASLQGYLLRDSSLNGLANATMPAAPPVTFNPNNYVQPTTPASTAQAFTQSLPQNVANNTAATQTAQTGQTGSSNGGFDMNSFFQMLALILGLGGNRGNTIAPQAQTGPTSRNPLWYSNYF